MSILEPIGNGTFGAVYLARDEATGEGRTRAVAFGGGYTFDQAIKRELEGQDAVQLTPLN